uniref:Uncharacterized protein n=1 Tax=Rhizophora mucronata TaxID=61149 RepID=A0A2P2J2J4_RHIMU
MPAHPACCVGGIPKPSSFNFSNPSKH